LPIHRPPQNSATAKQTPRPQEELDSQLLAPAPVPSTKVPAAGQALPNVPTTAAAAKAKQKTQEEMELEALQAEMAL
jgi:hypothetical protein